MPTRLRAPRRGATSIEASSSQVAAEWLDRCRSVVDSCNDVELPCDALARVATDAVLTPLIACLDQGEKGCGEASACSGRELEPYAACLDVVGGGP